MPTTCPIEPFLVFLEDVPFPKTWNVTEDRWEIFIECPNPNVTQPFYIEYGGAEVNVHFDMHHWHPSFGGEYEEKDLPEILALIQEVLEEKLVVVSKYQRDRFKLSYSCEASRTINASTEKPHWLFRLFGHRPDRITIRSWKGTYDKEFMI